MAKKNVLSLEERLKEALTPVEKQPYEIPNNWEWVKCEYILEELKNGKTTTQNKEGKGVKVTRIESVQNKTIDMNRVGYIEDISKLSEIDYYEEGDIALSHINSYEHVGKTAFIKKDHLPLVHGMNLLRYRFHNQLNKKYLFWLMNDIHFRTQVKDRVNRAVNQVSINQKQLKEIFFPLPPLAEQERIVTKVESMLEKVKQAKELIGDARDTFENRRASILHKAFTGELTEQFRIDNIECTIEDTNRLLEKINEEKIAKWEQECQITAVEGKKKPRKPKVTAIEDMKVPVEEHPYELPKGWSWIKFGEIGDLSRGQSKHRPRNDERLFGGDYPFIQTGDVARAKKFVESHSKGLSEFGMQQSKLFPKGTLCITIAANIADTALLNYDCCFPDSVVGFNSYLGYDSNFLITYYVESIKNELEHYAPAIAQKNINLKILNIIPVPLPPLTEQEELLRKVDELLKAEEDALELLKMEDQIELLEKSILSKAFRGELGTEDETDEPAMELIKRLLDNN